MVAQLYTFIKTHSMTHFKSLNFTVHKLYLNKTFLKKKTIGWKMETENADGIFICKPKWKLLE